jgi:AcrR family transcriptional regulator
MGLREEKKERQKRDIYRTAVKLFHEKGYEETRVEDIVRRLRISRATFFNYYPSKDSILHQIAEDAVRFYRTRLEEEITAQASTREKIHHLLDDMGKGIEADKRFYRAVFLEIMRGQMGLVSGQVSMEKATIGKLTASIISQGQQEGEIRSDYPALQLAEILVGAYNNVILNWLHSEATCSLVQRLKEAADFFLSGSAADASARRQASRASLVKRAKARGHARMPRKSAAAQRS